MISCENGLGLSLADNFKDCSLVERVMFVERSLLLGFDFFLDSLLLSFVLLVFLLEDLHGIHELL